MPLRPLVIAAALWVVLCIPMLIWAPTALGALAGLLLPLAFGAGAVLMRRGLRAEIAALAAEVDALRNAPAPPRPQMTEIRLVDVPRPPETPPEPEEAPEAAPASERGADPAPPEPEPEPEPEPIALDDLLRALHFPLSAEDREGFAALRRVLRDGRHARLVQAAQDVLTLLAEDGVYMDDLDDAPAPAAAWRALAAGDKGALAPPEATEDRTALMIAAARLREDAVFHDVVGHYLRAFDTFAARFAAEAEDEDLAALAHTRSARAFALLGQAAGLFPLPAPEAPEDTAPEDAAEPDTDAPAPH